MKYKPKQRTVLRFARTILHEYIHTDIFRKLNTKYASTEDLDFKKTYDKYESEKHHETMAELYIESMTNTLKQFHKTSLTDDFNKYVSFFGGEPTDKFYEALAWQGLKNHNVQAYTNLSDSEKKVISDETLKLDFLTKNCPN